MFLWLIFLKDGVLKYSGYKENELFTIVNPICEGYNTRIVQFNSAVVNKNLQVRIVLYKKGGINMDSCTEISKAVMPRIEVWADDRDVNLEVSSPGVGRVLKDAYEFQIFIGEKIKILTAVDWIEGTILEADESSVTIQTDGKNTGYDYGDVHKAKLD